ncbi:hypothetical protein MKW94_023436 [Papaver nudicaule]|uniref:RING-type domain-containing protein n=1 Tax=Papaver nudicaule TaxID=74823 RepID=A0AA41VPX8_PAPNU|nr:hypothetical protein [Papaver nudicaule]
MGNMATRNLKVPKFILLIFYSLSIINSFISFILQILGFGKLVDPEDITTSQTENQQSVVASADLIRRSLPVVKFEDLILTSKTDAHDQDSCAICLCDYEGQDEIRPLMNCRHIFHGSCLDRWMINNQRSCPLCRTSLVPSQIDEKKAFEECNFSVSSLET